MSYRRTRDSQHTDRVLLRDIYNYEGYGDYTVLDCSQNPEEDIQPIFREEAEIAVAALKRGSLQELMIYQQNLFKLAGRP